jgi:hypothetical protein
MPGENREPPGGQGGRVDERPPSGADGTETRPTALTLPTLPRGAIPVGPSVVSRFSSVSAVARVYGGISGRTQPGGPAGLTWPRPASQQAAASLADLGEAAAPALRYALFNAPSAEVQARVAEVPGAIGRALPPRRRVPIQADLFLAGARVRGTEVAAAIGGVLATLHPGAGSAARKARLG